MVVGAGQAGLAMGYFLARRGLGFLILERASAVGPAWRERWDSLVLFTPARFSGLPGLPFPGEPDHHPSRDEVVAYLERYAERFRSADRVQPPGQLGRGPRRPLRRARRATSSTRRIRWSSPPAPSRCRALPDFAERLAPEVVQMHSTGYRRPGDLPGGAGPGGGRGEHRGADRPTSWRPRRGPPRARLSADAAAAAAARPRPLLVAHHAPPDGGDGRFARRPADEGPRHLGRLLTAAIAAAPRGDDPPAGNQRRGQRRRLRGRHGARGGRRDLGDRLPPGPCTGSACPRGRAARSPTVAASPTRPGSTSSVRPGGTRGSALLGWVAEDAEFIAEEIAGRHAAGGATRRSAAAV